MSVWVSHYGLPELLIHDSGGEFVGLFSAALSQYGVYCHCIDAAAAHQNGRCERAGGLWKRQMKWQCGGSRRSQKMRWMH
eukprot:2540156-Amphidinium_carterae.1